MKKRFMAVLAAAIAVTFAGFAVAADNASKPVPAKKEAAPAAKPKSQLITGTIEAVDAAAGTFTVKGKKGNVELKAGDKVKLGDLKVGDRVTVKYADGKASKVTKVKATEKKAEAKPAEKKASPAPSPAAPPAPAAAPATAPPPAKK